MRTKILPNDYGILLPENGDGSFYYGGTGRAADIGDTILIKEDNTYAFGLEQDQIEIGDTVLLGTDNTTRDKIAVKFGHSNGCVFSPIRIDRSIGNVKFKQIFTSQQLNVDIRSYAIDLDDNLWAFVRGGDSAIWQKVDADFTVAEIVHINFGGTYTVILDTDGYLRGWGQLWRLFFNDGIGGFDENGYNATISETEFGTKLSQLTFKKAAFCINAWPEMRIIFCLTTDNNLYRFGGENDGDPEVNQYLISWYGAVCDDFGFIPPLGSANIDNITVAMLKNSGQLWTSGPNTDGIAATSYATGHIPHETPLNTGYSFAAGTTLSNGYGNYFYAIHDTIEPYVWGANDVAQLGFNPVTIPRTNIPTQWSFGIYINTVRKVNTQVLMLDVDKQIYTCGSTIYPPEINTVTEDYTFDYLNEKFYDNTFGYSAILAFETLPYS